MDGKPFNWPSTGEVQEVCTEVTTIMRRVGAINKEEEARLSNWGLFCRFGNLPGLGLTTWPQLMREFWGEPGIGITIPNELDAIHLENIISTMDVMGRDMDNYRGDLYAFILKLEYIEIGRPVQERAKHVRRKFKIKCGERQYYRHISNARDIVFTFAEPMK